MCEETSRSDYLINEGERKLRRGYRREDSECGVEDGEDNKEMKMNGFPLQCEFKRERERRGYIGFSVVGDDIFRNF